MGKYQIGEFEEVVLLTVAVLHCDAYGVSIKKQIEEKLKRKVSVGALQTCLVRLQDKGYVSSKEGETSSERGGRPKRYFEITAFGKKALQDTREMRNSMWSQIPQVILDL